MTPEPTDHSWRKKFTLAAITGLTSGTARAIITWLLEHLASGL